MHRAALLLSLSAVMAGASAAGQPAQPAQGTAHEPATPLSGLTVAVPSTPPVVTATYPAADAVVTPGVLVLKVAFDQAMDPEGWSYAKGEGGDYPSCLDRPRRLADGKTFVLLCTTAPGRPYAVAINGDGRGFTSAGRRAAGPFVLRFSTSRAESIHTVKAAMDAAGLKDDESPIEGDRPAPPAGPSMGAPPAPGP